MIELTHYNDGKHKYQSHEIGITESDWYNTNMELYSHNPFDVTGYGATQEEAMNDFVKKFEYIMLEWQAFHKMLTDTDVITSNIVEVQCSGKRIEKGGEYR